MNGDRAATVNRCLALHAQQSRSKIENEVVALICDRPENADPELNCLLMMAASAIAPLRFVESTSEA